MNPNVNFFFDPMLAEMVVDIVDVNDNAPEFLISDAVIGEFTASICQKIGASFEVFYSE